MDRVDNRRLSSRVMLVFEEQLDNVVRCVRPSWLTNLFMMVYTTMVICLLLMLFMLVGYIIHAPENEMIYDKNTENPIIKERTTAANLDPFLGMLYMLGLLSVLGLVLCYGNYRWCSDYGLHSPHMDYEQI